MLQDLAGKTALITGGAGSIGSSTAKLFLEHGAHVVLVDTDAEALAGVAERLAAYSGQFVTYNADVSDEKQTSAYIDFAISKFGSIDVLFSNAGNFGIVRNVEDYPLDIFQSVLNVNVTGAFLAAKYAVPHMKRGGSIIITSSVAGLRGDPGVYGYITAKHALTGLMRVLAKELAPRGIRVNTINPGPVDNQFQADVETDLSNIIQRDATEFFNEIIPMGRHASPEEIAKSVYYLASDLSAFTTGITLSVDGGMSI